MTIAQPEDISYDLAFEAYRNSSFEPEKRAASAQRTYADDVNGVYAEMEQLCTNDAQRTILAMEMQRFKENYLKHYTAILHAQSRTAGAFVVGPAKFPTERNQRRLDTEQRRREEFATWRGKARAAIKRKLLAARTDDEQESADWAVLRRDLAGSLAIIAGIDAGTEPYTRSAFVNSIAGKVERLAQNGQVALVEQALDLVTAYNASHKKPAITRRHKFWTFGDLARQQAQAARQDSVAQVIATGAGWRIERNPDLDRVQIFFDEKPPQALRDKLKGAGWKWAPSRGAWQRKLTENAIAGARQIVG